MKRMQFTAVAGLIGLLMLPASMARTVAEPSMCSLTVKAWGFKSNDGTASIGLWTSPDHWTEDAGRVAGARSPIKSLKAEAHFDHLACGSYAIALFHDENGNGKLDRNFIGIPREGYGFSGSGDYRYGPAKFQEALVPVTASNTVIEIKLINVR